MLRSLLLVTAGAASGWLAHRALGDRAEAPWAAQFLPHTGPIIEGETVEPPSPSGPGGPRPQTTIPTTTTQKDTHA